jgi:5-amino-6-(5-phosphoribosylamino)uracil reductase
MEPIVYRQLLPACGVVTAPELIGSLDLVRGDAPVQRPYTVATFVTSADGHTTIDGQSRRLSDDGDRELHRTLRERVDAVLAGTATMAAEDYARMLPAPARRERRLAAGRAAEPVAVMISRSGKLPLDIRLFAEPQARVVVFSPRAADVGTTAADVAHEQLDADTPLAHALATLRREHGVQTLLCEGGGTLFSALLKERLVDELFLTIAPVLVGGHDGPSVTSATPASAPPALELAGVAGRAGSLFLRYRLL